MALFSSLVFPYFLLITIDKIIFTFFLNFLFTVSIFPPFLLFLLKFHSSIVSRISNPAIFFLFYKFLHQFVQIFPHFSCFNPGSSSISLASFKFIISCPSFSWISTPFSLFSSFFISFSPSSFFSFTYPNYTIVMISAIFLDISLLFSCCCFSFLLFFLSFPIQRSLFLFCSFLCLFSSHSSSFNFNPVFLIH